MSIEVIRFTAYPFFVLLIVSLVGCNSDVKEVAGWMSLLEAEDSWEFKVVDTAQAGWLKECFHDDDWSDGAGRKIKDVGLDKKICLRIPLVECDSGVKRVVFKKEFWKSGFLLFLNEELLLDTRSKEFVPLGDVEIISNEGLGIHPRYKYQSYNVDLTLFNKFMKPNENRLTVVFDGVGLMKSKDKLWETQLLAYFTKTEVPVFDVGPITPQKHLDTTNLPLLTIETTGEPLPVGERIVGRMSITDNENSVNVYGDSNVTYSGKIDMKLRGHVSLTFPKKQFLIRSLNDENQKTPESLLGLPEGEKWVLNGSILDFSFFRNRMAYDLFEGLGHYSTRSRFCELVIDDNYQGVYSLIEKIEIGENRFDIGEKISDTEDLSGSWLLEIDRTKPNDVLHYSKWPQDESYRKNAFIFKDPKPDKLSGEMRKKIGDKINDFELALIKNGDFLSYIDTSSFIDYIIINELAKNTDAYRLSTYIHCTSEALGGKIGVGPIWDFDMAFGVNEKPENVAKGFVYSGEHKWYAGFWWEHLMRNEAFRELFVARYKLLRSSELSLESLHNRIDNYVGLLNASQERNFTKWNVLNTDFLFRNYEAKSYSEEVEYIKWWLEKRLLWLDTHWGLNSDSMNGDTVDLTEN